MVTVVTGLGTASVCTTTVVMVAALVVVGAASLSHPFKNTSSVFVDLSDMVHLAGKLALGEGLLQNTLK